MSNYYSVGLIVVLIGCLSLFTCRQWGIFDASNTYIASPEIQFDLTEIQERDTLKAITTYSATSYFLYKGQPMGYEYEMLRNFTDHLGVELDLKIMDDEGEMYCLLESGEADVIALGCAPISAEQNDAWLMRANSCQLDSTLAFYLASIDHTLDYAMLYNRYFKYKRDFSRKRASKYYVQRTGNLSDFDELIQQYADSLGWDWRLLAAQVYQESRFNPMATSFAGAKGLMQMMPATAAAYGVITSDPHSSLEGGVAYLKYLDEFWNEIDDQNERIKFVLASYNAGPYHVKDAQRLADKYGYDACSWDSNVAHFLQQKSNPDYYNDDVVKHGYCRGSEPTNYVKDILKLSRQYSQLIDA